MDSKEIKPVSPKKNQPWIFIRKTDAEAPILWPPDVKSRLIEKDPDAGNNWVQEEKGVTGDKVVRCHDWLNGMSLSKLWEIIKDKEAWHSIVHEIAKSQGWLSNWTTLINQNILSDKLFSK